MRYAGMYYSALLSQQVYNMLLQTIGTDTNLVVVRGPGKAPPLDLALKPHAILVVPFPHFMCTTSDGQRFAVAFGNNPYAVCDFDSGN